MSLEVADRRGATGSTTEARLNHHTALRRVLQAGGRAALWTCVLLMLVRGLGDSLETDGARDTEMRGEHQQPDEAVRAFAVAAARAYLSGGRAGRSYIPRGVGPIEPAPRNTGVHVVSATVAGEKRLSGRRWLVTVACELTADPDTRYLAVPVQRDSGGALATFAPPAVVSGPAVTRIDIGEPSPLEGRDAPRIELLARRFLAGYLTGAKGEPSYLTAPGARLRAVGGFELLGVDRVGQLSDALGQRLVIAEARARDQATRTTYSLAYRLELIRRGRWYVAGVQGALS